MPTAYFKALLGYTKAGTIGITSQTGGYTALGFWYEHEPYSGEVMDRALTIAELEEQTGFDFFVNLKSKIGQELYEKVETTKDGWWK